MHNKAYLYHHGILGQKWGKRNGPPYPLDPSDHSAAEKKAASKKHVDNNNDKYENKSRKGLSDKAKKNLKTAAKIGAIAAATALAAYGAYKLGQSGKLDSLINSGRNAIGGASLSTSNSGPTQHQISKYGLIKDSHSLFDDARSSNTVGGKSNCSAVSTSVLLRNKFGLNVTSINRGACPESDLERLWPGGKFKNIVDKEGFGIGSHEKTAEFLNERLKDGDCGYLNLYFKSRKQDPVTGDYIDSHFMTFFKKDGKILFVDGQPALNGGHGLPEMDGSSKFSAIFDMMDINFDDVRTSFMNVNGLQLTNNDSVLDKFLK